MCAKSDRRWGKRRTQMCTNTFYTFVHKSVRLRKISRTRRTLHALFVKPCSEQLLLMRCLKIAGVLFKQK